MKKIMLLHLLFLSMLSFQLRADQLTNNIKNTEAILLHSIKNDRPIEQSKGYIATHKENFKKKRGHV